MFTQDQCLAKLHMLTNTSNPTRLVGTVMHCGIYAELVTNKGVIIDCIWRSSWDRCLKALSARIKIRAYLFDNPTVCK